MTCEDTTSTTGLPVSEAGVLACALPDGQTTDLFGQPVAPANHSARPAISVAATMSGTYGLRSSSSSASCALQLRLVSRLPELLDMPGGTMWRLTWKAQDTPQRRRICRLHASVDRTHERASSGWLPTVRAAMGKHMICWSRAESGEHRSQLEDYLAWKYMEAGGMRLVGANVDPLLCATMMGYPASWLDSATRLCRSSRRDS